MYDCVDYANSRLIDTVVMHGREPVEVLRIKSNWMCAVRVFDEDLDDAVIEVPYVELTIKGFPLGFYETDRGGVRYIARMPMRRDWRQGLRNNNCSEFNPKGELIGRAGFNSIIRCLKREYIPLNKALDSINQGLIIKAVVNSNFALFKSSRSGNVFVHYKWYGNVGVIEDGVGEVKFKPKFLHLKQVWKDEIQVD